MGTRELGGYYLHEDGSLWRLVGYCAEPTATLERVVAAPDFRKEGEGSPPRVRGAVGAPIFAPFTRLVPATEGEEPK